MAATFNDRRRLLAVLTSGLIALISVLVFAPAIAFVTGPLRRRAVKAVAGSDFADVGPTDSIPDGKWTLRSIEITRQDGWVKTVQSRSVWVFKKSETPNEIRVLSPICTHLGCPVGWNADSAQFRCPCHGGIFDTSGAMVSGPPPRGMDALDFEVRNNHLWVRWQDFRISVKERVAVQV